MYVCVEVLFWSYICSKGSVHQRFVITIYVLTSISINLLQFSTTRWTAYFHFASEEAANRVFPVKELQHSDCIWKWNWRIVQVSQSFSLLRWPIKLSTCSKRVEAEPHASPTFENVWISKRRVRVLYARNSIWRIFVRKNTRNFYNF